jgi:hypothetical protein
MYSTIGGIVKGAAEKAGKLGGQEAGRLDPGYWKFEILGREAEGLLVIRYQLIVNG